MTRSNSTNEKEHPSPMNIKQGIKAVHTTQHRFLESTTSLERLKIRYLENEALIFLKRLDQIK